MPNHLRSRTQNRLLPPHQLTIMAANHGTTQKRGNCRCGWSAVAADSDKVAELFRTHVEAQQGVLL